MPLPAKVVDTNTATFGDHKNQPCGPVQGISHFSFGTDNGTFFSLGNDAEYVGAEHTKAAGWVPAKLVRVRFFLEKVGSPTGEIVAQLRPNVSEAPDFNTLLSQSQAYPVSAVPASKTEIIFTFVVPYNVVIGNYFILLKISAQGDASNHVKVYRRAASPFALDGGTRAFGSSTWVQDAGNIPTHVTEYALPDAYAFAVDKTNNKIRAYRSTDSGATWTEQDSADALACTSTANLKSLYVQRKVDDMNSIWVLRCKTGTTVLEWSFLATGTAGGSWNSPFTSVTVTEVRTNVSGQAPVMGGVRALTISSTPSHATVVYQGAQETVMGTPRTRLKLRFWNGSGWSSEFDVAGSTNTPNSTLPGTAVDHHLRWCAMDPNGDTHIVYSQSDTSTLQYRKFKLNGTFTTINTLNGAVASNSAAYPVGQGCFYYQNSEWFVAIPYIDSTSSTLKVARCKGTITETSANWTVTEIVAANGETTTSNPAVLATDGPQGSKLLCWRVDPTSDDLFFTDDGGTNTWKPEVAWRSGQNIEGLSSLTMEDGAGLAYLDTTPTPDELRYDRL